MAGEFLRTDRFSSIGAIATIAPPSWTRLEPQSCSGDPTPGLEARLHDPLWLLGRQWQLGEFQGEDAGTPLTVRVVTRNQAIDRWSRGDDGDVHPFGREGPELLEPRIEREPPDGTGPGLRGRAEAGAVLLQWLDEAGLKGHVGTVVGAHPLSLDPGAGPGPEHAALDASWSRLARMLAAAPLLDAEALARQLDAAAGGLPDWLVTGTPEEEAGLQAVFAAWHGWYRTEVSPTTATDDAWRGDRLEYRFTVGAGDTALVATAHDGGRIDWYSFDPAPQPLGEPVDAPPRPPQERRVHALLASPLRYPGMPADRFWEMEDARVHLGLIESEPWDLARLLVAEFALTYGNDWLVVPVDLPLGSITQVESVVYRTTFGESFIVPSTATATSDARWRMFTIAGAEPPGIDGLLIPPSAVAVEDGEAIEEVLLLRDEMANMVWAVERTMQGPSGLARPRAPEHIAPASISPGPVTTAQLDYRLQIGPPEHWIPYLPRAAGYRAVELVQGRMLRPDGTPCDPLGRLLARPDIRLLKDAEVPREGVVVRRRPSLTRHADGRYERWITRQTGVGRGEGASRLSFDAAQPRSGRRGG